MAYGLDVEDVYYTDHDRVDKGILDTYKVQLDCADEKNFTIVSPSSAIPLGGFWYIQDTEYGGIVDGYESDSEEHTVTYNGRSFRGILASKIIEANNSIGVVYFDGTMQDVVNEMLEMCDLELFAECDEALINEYFEDDVSVAITNGTTLYDAIIQAGLSCRTPITVQIEFRKDKKMHILPVGIQDYTEVMTASDVGDLGFTLQIDNNVVNHLITDVVNDEDNTRKTIHFFTDIDGVIQPFRTGTEPFEDSDYILDKSSQVLFGIDEISEYTEETASKTEGYRLVNTAPSDWSTRFGEYYKKNEEVDDDGVVTVTYEAYTAIEPDYEDPDNYKMLTQKPKNWNSSYSNYFSGSYDETQHKMVFSAVSADSVLNYSSARRVRKVPADWKWNYGEYYYKFNTGVGSEFEYRPYDSTSKNKYTRLTRKPSDWKTNFSSYYRAYLRTVTTEVGPRGGKKKKVKLKDVQPKDANYFAGVSTKSGKAPKWKPKYPVYRRDSVSKPPKFNADNTYRVNATEVAPTFSSDDFYKFIGTATAPAFVSGQVYEQIIDNFENAVNSAEAFFESQQRTNIQTITVDDFDLVIGDIIGGRDEFTRTQVYGSVTNANITIENGLLDVQYEVSIDAASSGLIEESEEESE